MTDKTKDRNAPPHVVEALRRVLDYLMDDEAADYLATSPGEDREGHIYSALVTLDRWLSEHVAT